MFFSNDTMEPFYTICEKCNQIIYITKKESKIKCPNCSHKLLYSSTQPAENNDLLLQKRDKSLRKIQQLKQNYDVKQLGERSYLTLCPSCGFEIVFSYNEWNHPCKNCGYLLNRALSPPIELNENISSINNPLYHLAGVNGELFLYSSKIIISRNKSSIITGLSQGFTKGDKTIYINQISGVQLKLAGLTNGYIQFTISGGKESTGGAFDATTDENTVMFSSANNEIASQIQQKIDEIKDSLHNNKTGSVDKPSLSGADEIRKFKQLMDEGIITQEEFEMKKKQLLEI